MLSKILSLAAIAGAASAQSLTEALSSNQDLSALAGLVGSLPQDVQQSLGSATNVTILAPNNAAIEAVLRDTPQIANDTGMITAILQYHVINGTFRADQIPDDLTFVPTLLTNETYSLVTGGQRVGVERDDSRVTIFSGAGANSSVVTPNVNFTGGVIHVINSVLTVPTNVSTTAVAANLSAIAGALTAADLVTAVDSTPDVTIFVPSNAAFEAISGALGNFSTEQLTEILTYHVINGTVAYSNLLTDGQQVPTLEGGSVTIHLEDDEVFVNNARVITPNVLVRNGVVHVIDNVLSPNATQTSQGPIVPSATGTNVPFTTQGPSATATGNGGASSSSSSSAGASMPTGAMGVAALLGAAAVAMNY